MATTQEKSEITKSTAGCRTIHQYNKEPLSDEDMKKLQEIADDYRKVKNYVYSRYGGIGSLAKLYPGYTIQNEMTDSGLREELAMPSVYFYRAVFDALGDIKCQWSKTKTKILKLIGQHESFTAEEKHYLRFLIRFGNAFEAVINQKPVQMVPKMQVRYEELVERVDAEKLHKYLCRQVRKHHIRTLHTDAADGFFITGLAYRYGLKDTGGKTGCQGKKYGIFISAKEKRKRIFVPLTDGNSYKQQLYIKLKPEVRGIEISIPIEMKIKKHWDYINEIGISIGIWCMLTTHEGNTYGERFGELHRELVEYMSAAARTYNREKKNNVGRKKYKARKAKLDAGMETYINQEINRMIAEEKPAVIYLPRLPKSNLAGYNKKINYSIGIWKKGLIRERLEQKCREHSIEIVEVFGRAISRECSRCGAEGSVRKEVFSCGECGYETDKKKNAAQNAYKRGRIEIKEKQKIVH